MKNVIYRSVLYVIYRVKKDNSYLKKYFLENINGAKRGGSNIMAEFKWIFIQMIQLHVIFRNI